MKTEFNCYLLFNNAAYVESSIKSSLYHIYGTAAQIRTIYNIDYGKSTEFALEIIEHSEIPP